jgi:hypothetical protein
LKHISIASVVLSLLALPAIAQPTISNPWVGLWQPSLEDPPGVVLTVGDDNGRLAGAVVFNVIAHEGGQTHILGHDAHALLNPRVDGDTLHFQVIRRSDNRTLDMTVHMTADGKATFHCQNCGEGAPGVEIIRER